MTAQRQQPAIRRPGGIEIERGNVLSDFAAIPNRLAQDLSISVAARGLALYLISLPPGWHLTMEQLARQSVDSRYALLKALAELQHTGYAQVIDVRGARGKFRRKLRIHAWPVEVTERTCKCCAPKVEIQLSA